MNIIVIGDVSSTNLGDPILTYSTEHIIKQICQDKGIDDVKTKIFDLADRSIKYVPTSEKMREICTDSAVTAPTKKSVTRTYRTINIRTKIKWLIKDRKKFRNRLENHIDRNDDNLFVIAGGALLSRSLYYSLRIAEVIQIAEKHGYKVIFNAVGIEKCSGKSSSRKLIQSFLKKDVIIGFSTRDSKESVYSLTAKNSFFNQVPDPGIWSSEAFGVSKTESETVGIGTISAEAYTSVVPEDKRAESVNCEALFAFWKAIIDELESRDIPWKLFTNGGAKDCQMAFTFLKRNGYSIEEHLVPPADDPRKLVEQIAQFKSVVAHRLHALIIASSLGIPVVPVVWSNKVVNFSKLINNQSYIWPTIENGKKAAKLLTREQSAYESYDNIEKCKEASYEYLAVFIKK